MLNYKVMYFLLIIDTFRMIVPALLRAHKQTRIITLYFTLNKYFKAIEQTMLIVFILFKGLTKNL